MLKVKLQKSPKYSRFRILLKAAEGLGIFSIPVRVTILQSHRWLKIVVCGFCFFSKNALSPLSATYFQNQRLGRRLAVCITAGNILPCGCFFLTLTGSSFLPPRHQLRHHRPLLRSRLSPDYPLTVHC